MLIIIESCRCDPEESEAVAARCKQEQPVVVLLSKGRQLAVFLEGWLGVFMF
ncbi:MAG: hypothetical protein ACLUI7_01800 [Coprococcus sp.]